jgi:hypothetical protein
MSHVQVIPARKQADHWLTVFSQGLLYALGLFVLGYCYLEYRRVGLAWTEWDLMLITGVVAFIVALALARTIPRRMSQTLDRLAKRSVFELSEEELAQLQQKFEERSRLFSRVGAVLVGLVMLVTFLVAYGGIPSHKIPLTVLEVFLGAVAGYYIGQMIAYGTLGQLSVSERIPVSPRPGHIDRAAGLKPIGDLYFFQAMVVAIPCVYLAVWWFLIPLLPEYRDWRSPYLGLLAVALLLEILSFLLPMWVFHLIMQQQKVKSLAEADELSKKIIELENRILRSADARETNDLQKQLDFQREKYWEIENMPTWPIDATTRRRFTVNNLFLFLPFLSDVVRLSAPWKLFLEALQKFLNPAQ